MIFWANDDEEATVTRKATVFDVVAVCSVGLALGWGIVALIVL